MFSERVQPSTRARPRAQKKAETRKKLLRVARRLFERHGFEGTTLRLLAKETGLAPGTVFVHFKDKHALLAATLYERVETALGHPAARKATRTRTRAQLVGLAEPLLRHYAKTPDLSRVLLKEGLFMAGDEGQRFDTQLARFQTTVERVYANAVTLRELVPKLDCRQAATAFLAFYLFTLVAGLRGQAPTVEAQLALLDGLVEQQLAGWQRRPR
jgi:AcrR family transcriptional regulator